MRPDASFAGQAPLILVGGGVRTGKSRFALERAARLGARRAFIATAEALDDEMEARIRAHQRERGDGFRLIEEPVDLPRAIEGTVGRHDVVVVDCLTLWVSNLLVRGAKADDLAAQFQGLIDVVARRAIAAVLVTNEVGLGLVPETPLGRTFRDQTGLLHQRLAAMADEIYAGLMGVVLRLRPDPVAVAAPSVGAPK